MKKETEVTKKYVVEEYYCDECGKPAKNSWGNPYICCVCKRHFCDDHIVFDNRDSGDYPNKYCNHCWDIGKRYRDDIVKIDDECCERIDKKNEEWYQEAIKNLKENK